MKSLKGLITLVAGFALAGIMASPSYANFINFGNTGPGGAPAGTPITYTIGVETSVVTEGNLVITDTLPLDANSNPQVSYLSSSCSTPSGPGACVGPTVSATSVVWNIPGSWPVGSKFDLTLTVAIDTNQDNGVVLANNASVTSTNVTMPQLAATANTTVKSALLRITSNPIVGFCSGNNNLEAKDPTTSAEICGPVVAGQTIKYEFYVDNNTPAISGLASTGVVIQDLLPTELLTLVPGSATITGTGAGAFQGSVGGLLTWTVPTLAPTQYVVLSYNATVASTIGNGTFLFNIATAYDAAGHVSNLGTNNLVGNSPSTCLAVTDTSVVTPVDSTCDGVAQAGRTSPVPDDTVTYTITVNNAAGCGATGAVSIQAPVPTGTTYVPGSCLPANDCFFDGTNVNFIVTQIGSGPGSTMVIFRVTVNNGPPTVDGTAISATAAVTTQAGGKGAATNSLTVHTPILTVSKSVSPNPIGAGQTLTYSIILTNSGKNCAHNVNLTDVLPPLPALVKNSISFSGNCTAAGALFCSGSTCPTTSAPYSKFTLTPFDLGVGKVCRGTFQMVVPDGTATGTTIQNSVSAVDFHKNASNTATATSTINTDLIGTSLTKTATGCACTAGQTGPLAKACTNGKCDPNNVPAGAVETYTIQVTAGPYGATNVKLSDILPSSGATYYGTDCPRGTQTGVLAPAVGSTGGTVTCLVGTMAPNSTTSFDVELLINASNAAGTHIINTATASDDAMDVLSPVALNITDAVDVVVASDPSPDPAPALQLSVTPNTNSVKLSHKLVMLATVTNTGDADAQGVVVTGQLGGGMQVYGAIRAAGLKVSACKRKGTGTFTCNLGNLASGGSRTLTLPVLVPPRRNGAKVGDQIKTQLNASATGGVSTSTTTSTTVMPRK